MMKRDKLWAILIVAAFFLSIFCAGCGKKADPRYPHVDYPGEISDLKVSIDKEGRAVLEWSVPVERGDAGHVKILKSALKTDGTDCPDCPRIYVITGYLPLRDLSLDEKGRFMYLDRNIRRGFLYSYRVVICNSSGMCGGESNTAKVGYYF
ncbi:MAG: hypothetical protein JRD43_02445 [Deltaproteobacteria bacterium]|nr:hypothetical protein [Deltaproteobacteria bacterium]MBW2596252.1 hypothetical protein [Deltaproteobacteria bacterium]